MIKGHKPDAGEFSSFWILTQAMLSGKHDKTWVIIAQMCIYLKNGQGDIQKYTILLQF